MYEYQKKLKIIRKERGYTQTDIAILLNTTTQQYFRYEAGIRELPLHHAIKLAYFYKVSMDYLFKEDFNYE